MGRRLTDDQWLDIKTKYQLGGGIRAISREFGITDGAIRAKIKTENWTQSLRSEVSDIRDKYEEITQKYAPAQIPIIKQEIEKEINEVTQIMASITNLHKGALSLHGLVIKKAIQQTQTGEMSIKEASQVLANSGLKVDQIHKTYTPDNPQVAIQATKDSNMVINIVGK